MTSKRENRGQPPGPSAADPLTALEVLQRLRVVMRAAQRHSQWIERQSGVSGAQLWSLQELADAPGLKVGELAARLAIHQSTASNMLDRMESRGLVRRERKERDQRVVRLYLTPQGQEVLDKAPLPARGVLPEALRHLAPAEVSQLNAALDVLISRMGDLDRDFGLRPLPFNE
jgi:DNA-binding MarR family transcriptional regulator